MNEFDLRGFEDVWRRVTQGEAAPQMPAAPKQSEPEGRALRAAATRAVRFLPKF